MSNVSCILVFVYDDFLLIVSNGKENIFNNCRQALDASVNGSYSNVQIFEMIYLGLFFI
jgi:uncharacterized membrane protein affecting hemolysin expression